MVELDRLRARKRKYGTHAFVKVKGTDTLPLIATDNIYNRLERPKDCDSEMVSFGRSFSKIPKSIVL